MIKEKENEKRKKKYLLEKEEVIDEFGNRTAVQCSRE